MIPYDELVGALANWRAKQGLPVVPTSQISSPVMTESYAAPTPAPAARTTPPVAPPRASSPVAAQPPDMTVDEDVDDAALLEEAHYEPEGDDFQMAFGRLTENNQTGESTTVAPPPAPAAHVGTGDVTLDETDDLPPPPRPTAKKKRNW